ncbi:hypothetical protein AgCh_024022 [Apium graveolens]
MTKRRVPRPPSDQSSQVSQTDSSFSSGRPSTDGMFPSFGESFDMSSTPPRVSNMLDGDSQGFDFGRMSVETATATELSYSSSDGGSSASQPMYMPKTSTMETVKSKDGSVGLTYPMLTKSNYTAWALKMKVYMQTHGIWVAVEPINTKELIEVKTDKMALAAIYQGIPEDVLLSLADKETAKEAWDAVKMMCLGADRVKKARIQTLKAEFEFLNMKDSELIDDFCMKLNGLVTNIRALGETIDETYVVKKLLRSVPSRFLHITATIEQFGDLEKMTIEEAVGSLKAYEERLRGKTEVCGEQLLLTEEEWRKRQKNEGHLLLTREEWLKKPAKAMWFQGDDEPALLLVEHKVKERNQLLLNEQDTVPKLSHNSDKRIDSNVWYLDNGASNHMSGFRSKFKTLDDEVTGLVRFGDGSTVSIKGKGTVGFQCKNGEELMFHDVYFIPDLCNNIISLGQRSENGNKVILKEDYLWIYDGQERLVMKVQRSANRLYKITLETVPDPMCLMSKREELPRLWHARLGHVNYKTMNMMSEKGIVRGFPEFTQLKEICEGYLMSKHPRKSFPKQSEFRATKRLELIHGDLCGPITPATKGGNSMLRTMQVPSEFWGEVAGHAVYVLNRLPTRALSEKTPYEAWTRTKPDIGHIKIFGCVAYMKLPQVHTTKLSDRSKPVIYLGKEPGTKGYRLYDPVSGSMHEDFESHEAPDTPQTSNTSTRSSHGTPSRPQFSSASTDPNTTVFQPSAGSGSTQSVTRESNTQESDVSSQPRHFRLLGDIYNETEEVKAESELFFMGIDEPSSYREAVTEQVWKRAMQDEIDSIERNKTWELVELPTGHKTVGLKWVFKLKRDTEGNVIKHKARLVAKGYVQKQGIDYEEVFAPVTRLETVRLLLALAAKNGWQVHHLDVKSPFLNGELQETVYVEQPEGFVKETGKHLVYKLRKALYGLKQVPRAWYARLNKYLESLGFEKCPHEHAVYTKREGDEALVIGVYVDDLLITGMNATIIEKFKVQMSQEFDMSNLGLLSHYLGIEVSQNGEYIELRQSAYAKTLLERAGMIDCNAARYPMETKLTLHKDSKGKPVNATQFKSLVGGLRYLVHTRPDIAYAVGVVSRYMERPTALHHNVVKRILRYVKGTVGYGLVYTKRAGNNLLSGYSDSDLAGNIEDRRSTSGMAFYLDENLITWVSQKQRCVALSSCEAEFMAATAAACQAVWLRNLLGKITDLKLGVVTIYVDNRSAIDLARNPVFHGRSKHIDIRYHFIRECVERGDIEVKHVKTEEQRADILTKPMSTVKFERMRTLLGLKDLQ